MATCEFRIFAWSLLNVSSAVRTVEEVREVGRSSTTDAASQIHSWYTEPEGRGSLV